MRREQEAEAVIGGEVWEVYSIGPGYACEEQGCLIDPAGPDEEPNWKPAVWELRCYFSDDDEGGIASKALCHAHMEAFTGLTDLTPEPAR